MAENQRVSFRFFSPTLKKTTEKHWCKSVDSVFSSLCSVWWTGLCRFCVAALVVLLYFPFSVCIVLRWIPLSDLPPPPPTPSLPLSVLLLLLLLSIDEKQSTRLVDYVCIVSLWGNCLAPGNTVFILFLFSFRLLSLISTSLWQTQSSPCLSLWTTQSRSFERRRLRRRHFLSLSLPKETSLPC